MTRIIVLCNKCQQKHNTSMILSNAMLNFSPRPPSSVDTSRTKSHRRGEERQLRDVGPETRVQRPLRRVYESDTWLLPRMPVFFGFCGSVLHLLFRESQAEISLLPWAKLLDIRALLSIKNISNKPWQILALFHELSSILSKCHLFNCIVSGLGLRLYYDCLPGHSALRCPEGNQHSLCRSLWSIQQWNQVMRSDMWWNELKLRVGAPAWGISRHWCDEMAPRESVALPLPHLALTISAPCNGLEAFQGATMTDQHNEGSNSRQVSRSKGRPAILHWDSPICKNSFWKAYLHSSWHLDRDSQQSSYVTDLLWTSML